MKRILSAIWAVIALLGLIPAEAEQVSWNENTRIDEVTSYPAFGDWGRMIFPVDTGYFSGSALGSLRLTWYSNIQPAKTVEIVNYMREKADAGEQIFYRIPGRLTPGCSSSKLIVGVILTIPPTRATAAKPPVR